MTLEPDGAMQGLRARHLPARTLAQAGDVGHVMLAVPGVHRQIFLQGYTSQFGMVEPARKILGLEGTQQNCPTLVQGFEQS